MLELMRQMIVSIAELEAMADEQAALADDLNAHGAANAIRHAAGYHRARAAELRSELASFGSECEAKSLIAPCMTFGAFASYGHENTRRG